MSIATRIGAPIAVSLLIGLGMSGPAHAVDARLAIESITLEVGDEGSVLFEATDIEPPGVGAWTLDISYDPSIVAVTECVPSPLGFCDPAFEPDAIRVNGASATAVLPELTLARFDLRCLAPGTTQLTINVIVWGNAGFEPHPPPDLAIENGAVTCRGPSPNDGRLAIDSITLEVGDEGSVLFEATDIERPGVGAWTLDISYDPSVIAVTECVPSPLGFCDPEFGPETIRVNGASASGVMPSLTLATFTLRCLAPGASPLTIDVNTWGNAGFEQPLPDLQLTHGSVTCLAPTVEPIPTGQPTLTGELAAAPPVAGLPSTGTGGGESPTAWFTNAVVVLLAAAALLGVRATRRA